MLYTFNTKIEILRQANWELVSADLDSKFHDFYRQLEDVLDELPDSGRDAYEKDVEVGFCNGKEEFVNCLSTLYRIVGKELNPVSNIIAIQCLYYRVWSYALMRMQ